MKIAKYAEAIDQLTDSGIPIKTVEFNTNSCKHKHIGIKLGEPFNKPIPGVIDAGGFHKRFEVGDVDNFKSKVYNWVEKLKKAVAKNAREGIKENRQKLIEVKTINIQG